MAPTNLDGLGVAVGVSTVAPYMNDRNSKANIAQFATEFRGWFNGDKAKAMAGYEFGTIGKNSAIPFNSSDSKNNYVSDAMGVGEDVKKLLRKTLVENYFDNSPKPMKFSIGATSRVGGDLEVGVTQNADGEVFINVRILCMKPTP